MQTAPPRGNERMISCDGPSAGLRSGGVECTGRDLASPKGLPEEIAQEIAQEIARRIGRERGAGLGEIDYRAATIRKDFAQWGVPVVNRTARVLCGLVAMCIYLAPTAASAATPPTHVLQAYGDSLLWESKANIGAGFKGVSGWAVHSHATPGYSPCDWLTQEKKDLASKNVAIKPTVIVLEFAGNSWTTCMADPATGELLVVGSQGWLDKYRRDFDQFFGAASAAAVPLLVLQPVTVNPMATPFVNDLDALFAVAVQEAARYHGIAVEGRPRAATSVAGAFAMRVPCLANEGTARGCGPDGTILVREPPGLHFCPTGYPNGFTACPVYSSGAHRYGLAIAASAISPPAPLLA